MDIKELGVVELKEKSFPLAIGKETLEVYQKTFKRNLEKDLDLYEKLADDGMFKNGKNNKKALQIIWAFAKTADHTIKRPKTWIKQFDDNSLHDIFQQVEDIFTKEVMNNGWK
ncbi:hypothetical protein [Sporosarcina sp. P17b]|uniref:hypothetical protein n=1 Tax=Sporosarcina sp. P17b TaxID=2048260 RepID=UPI000C166B09|nr:hypothetical protein [Sporosarcina sp. P17b]PIC75046.1 hypothetical protein CSV76_00090 [Sporosarcina sp. P17b]